MDVAAVAGLREAVIADYIRGLQLKSDETAWSIVMKKSCCLAV